MLVTARELDCQHIWNAHAASARKAGMRNEIVDALRDRKELPALAADEAAVVHYGREFFRTRRVSRGAFQSALEQFGRQGLVELGLIMGNYSLLALLINSFDTDLPPDRTSAPGTASTTTARPTASTSIMSTSRCPLPAGAESA